MITLGKTKLFLLLVALSIFIFGLIYSFKDLDLSLGQATIPLCFILISTTILSMHLAIRRFEVLAASVSKKISYRISTEVVVWGGVANLLPLPGAVMVRTAFLAKLVGLRRSSLLNIASFFIWLHAAALIVIPFAIGFSFMAAVVTLLAASSLFISFLFFGYAKADFKSVAVMVFLQLIMTGVNVFRLMIIAIIIDVKLPILAASLMALTGVAASATGIFPGGLGVTEVFASLVGRSLHLELAVGFAVVAINRIMGWFGLMLFMPACAMQRSK